MMDYLILAAEQITEVLSFLDYINLGVIVVVLWAMLTRKIVPGWAHEEKDARILELEQQVAELQEEKDALRDKIEDKILPQLFETTSVLSELAHQRQRPLKAQ